jgi:hypothetical protein
MKPACFLSALVGAIALVTSVAAEPRAKATPVVVISGDSVRIGGIELRRAEDGFISLSAAKRALGAPSAQYSWGAPIYVWHQFGIALQTGWRGEEKGRIFKLQVYFEPSYDRRTEMRSAVFSGRLRMDGVDITAETDFESIASRLKNKGFAVVEGSNLRFARKGGIEVFQSESTGKIARIDAWCQ